MLVGILGFVLAAIVVLEYGPTDGFDTPLGWLPPLIYVIGFHLVQERIGRAGKKLMLASAQRGEPRPPSRPFILIAIQVLGLAMTLHLGWSRYVQERMGLGDWWLLPALLMFLPFFLVHISWLLARRAIHEAVEPDPWPTGSYLGFHLRLLALPSLPCLINISLNWLATRPSADFLFAAFPSLNMAAGLITGAVVVILSPLLMRLALRSRSLEAGPLRTSLEELSRRGNFKFLDIRVAETHGRVINALFVGVLGRLRYVFVTDALLARLSAEDMRGVFAHEMAHSRRGHILLNMALLVGFSLMMQVLGTVGFAEEEDLAGAMIAVVTLPVFLLMVFLPLMRTWETEADVYSGEILGDPGPIKRSLAELGKLHPKRTRNGGLTHPGIDSRLRFIDSYFADAAVAEAFRARIKRLRSGVLLFFILPLVVWGLLLPVEITRGRILSAIDQAEKARDMDLARSTLKALEDAVDRGAIDDSNHLLRATLWTTLAAGYQRLGAMVEAEPWVARMRENEDEFDNPIPIYNAAILQAQQEAGLGRLQAMLAPLHRAEEALEPIAAAYGEDTEDMRRERQDLAFLRGLEELGRRCGGLPRAVTPGPLPRSDRPADQALMTLAEESAAAPLRAARWAEVIAGLEPDWKRAALQALGPLEAPRGQH